VVAERHSQSATDRLIVVRNRLGKYGEVQELAIVKEIRPLPISVIEETGVDPILSGDWD